jgi:hypothetical protein
MNIETPQDIFRLPKPRVSTQIVAEVCQAENLCKIVHRSERAVELYPFCLVKSGCLTKRLCFTYVIFSVTQLSGRSLSKCANLNQAWLW